MAISLAYYCSECKFYSSALDRAQHHADTMGHCVDVRGTLTSRVIVIDAVAIEANAAKRAREAAIMRELEKRRGAGLIAPKPSNRPDLPAPAPTQPQTVEALLSDLVKIAVDQLRWQTFDKIYDQWRSAGHLAHTVLGDRAEGQQL